MKEATVALAALAALLLAVAAPALAQQGAGDSQVATAGVGQAGGRGSPPLPKYDFDARDGFVYIGGDIRTTCEGFALMERAGDVRDKPEQIQSVLRQCEEAGLLPSASAAPSASASSRASPGGAQGELPDSGALSSSMLLGTSAALLTAGALLARKAAG